MLSLLDWAKRWGIPDAALRELAAVPALEPVPGGVAGSESAAQSLCRLNAARANIHAWRNNVGALKDDTGRVVRYGLGNDNQQTNARFKSSDLVGLRPHLTTPADVGKVVGIFWCREIKRPGWHYTGTDREVAQLRYITLVNANGGDAAFSTGGI